MNNPYLTGAEMFTVYCTSDKKASLPYAHYSDERFKKAQLVFHDSSVSPNNGAYSDRLFCQNPEADDVGRNAANSSDYRVRTAGWFEIYLQGYFNNPNLKLAKVLTGFNLWNGYDYHYFEWSE
jgi:hypothetical protein